MGKPCFSLSRTLSVRAVENFKAPRTAAVFAALVDARQPLDARAIAATFRQGSKVEPAISQFWLGHAHTSDGATFALRRTA